MLGAFSLPPTQSTERVDPSPAQDIRRGRTEALLRQKGLNLRIAMRCESGEAVKAAVESGLGIGLLYRDNAEHGLKGGYLKALEIAWLKEIDFKWFIIYRKGEPLSACAQEFIRLLRQWSG